MKTNHRIGGFAGTALALALLLASAAAFAADNPTEQPAEQSQTLSASQTPFYREFDSFVNAPRPMPLMEVSRRMAHTVDEEPVRLGLALAWAKDKVSVKDFSRVNSLYFLIYSDMAKRSALNVSRNSPYYMAYSKAAYQALVTLELMFAADAARCVNPAAGAVAHKLVNPRYENLKYVEDAATPGEMETYWKTALNYEAASAARPGNAEICSNGVAEALAQDAGETPPDRVDGAFVADAKWQPLRDKARRDIAAQWQADYDAIRKAFEARQAYQEQKRAAAEAAKQAQAKADAVKAAADAEKQKAEDEKLAREKQERLDAQRHEAGKYHDTYVPEPSTGSDDSGN